MQATIKHVKPSAIACVKNTPTGAQASDRQMKAAVNLVTTGKVHVYDSRTLLVESQSEPGTAYELVKGKGACACYAGKQGKVCAHRLAAALYYCCITPAVTKPVITPATALSELFEVA